MTERAGLFHPHAVISRILVLLVSIAALSSAACRQPDGATPPTTEEALNRLNDLSRDLQSIAAGEQQARQDFVDDIKVFARSPAAEAAVASFAQGLGTLVAGSKLTEQGSQQLAHSAWTAVAATELSSRQIETLEAEMKTNLMAAGIPEDRATAAAGEVETVQEAITTRPRKWYEFF